MAQEWWEPVLEVLDTLWRHSALLNYSRPLNIRCLWTSKLHHSRLIGLDISGSDKHLWSEETCSPVQLEISLCLRAVCHWYLLALFLRIFQPSVNHAVVSYGAITVSLNAYFHVHLNIMNMGVDVQIHIAPQKGFKEFAYVSPMIVNGFYFDIL